VDVLQSVSRVMPAVTSAAHRAAAARVRELLAAWERDRDLIALGAYKKGADPVTDEAIARMPALEAFLCQGERAVEPLDETVARLQALVA
jgi:flagellar biosynthesis/type III secretory pathway ATPase